MPSITTQNIGPAVASVVQPAASATPQQREGAQLPNVNQVTQATRVASEKTSKDVEKNDKKRGVQVPKKVEASFTPQETKPKRSAEPKEEEREGKDDEDGLNVVA